MDDLDPELNKLIGEKNNSQNRSKAFDGIYIFLSFDLANSTAYKSLNPFWTQTFRMFREYSTKVMKEHFHSTEEKDEVSDMFCNLNWHIWKNLGDEIIYMFPNPNYDELKKLPDTCCIVLDKICDSLRTPTRNSSVKISVKATLWLAEIEDKKNENEELQGEPPYEKRNINIAVQDDDPYTIDFLGPDIDAGFRLSHYSNHNKLTIDARLAWILLTKGESDPNANNILKYARIVSYKPLKGVWNEKPYPIIWYIKNWESQNLFYYYEETEDKSLPYEIAKNNFKYTDITKLESILDDARQLEYTKYLYQKLKKNTNRVMHPLEDIYNIHKNAELHLICLCINEKDELLILQRSNEKRFLPGVWDFGCTFLRNDSTIKDSLITGYQYKIGAIIELLNNDLPIDSVIIKQQEDGPITNGLVFIGRINSSKLKINKEKYQNYKFIEKDTKENFSDPSKYVPDFSKLVKKAEFFVDSLK